jgi:hypothetical protein
VTEPALVLKRRLQDVGLSGPAIKAAWPRWWSDAAEASSSARAELRFSLARKLGLDPSSLLDENAEPRFVWRDEARFKHRTNEGELELAAITSFGKALSSLLISAAPPTESPALPDAATLRQAVLANQPYVRLIDLLSICWTLSIPVVHLRVFPCTRKRMAAMTVHSAQGNAILLAKDSGYPAHLAFYLAHELAHLALGHLRVGDAIVDLDTNHLSTLDDPEEYAADAYALELLTGQPRPVVLPHAHRYIARQLADNAVTASQRLRIEPGTLALCFGYSTGDWRTANAAMRSIYTAPKPAWVEINGLARKELRTGTVAEDSRLYLESILGLGDAG